MPGPTHTPSPAELRAHAAKLIAHAALMDRVAEDAPSPAAAAEAKRLRALAADLDAEAERLTIAQRRARQALLAAGGSKAGSRATVQKRGQGARNVKGRRSMSTAEAPDATGREKAVLAMAKANTKANLDHPFMKWIPTTEWRTASKWAVAHKLYRGTPNAWMAKGKAHRSCPDLWRQRIEDESGGLVPASCWD